MTFVGNMEHDVETGRAENTVTSKRFVKRGAAVKGILQCSVAGEMAIGVSKFDIVNGEVGPVVTDGITRVTSGAALALNAEVSTDADGKAKTAVSGEHVLGQALNATSGADEDFEIKIYRGKYIKP
jgi:hypothetical protein